MEPVLRERKIYHISGELTDRTRPVVAYVPPPGVEFVITGSPYSMKLENTASFAFVPLIGLTSAWRHLKRFLI